MTVERELLADDKSLNEKFFNLNYGFRGGDGEARIPSGRDHRDFGGDRIPGIDYQKRGVEFG